MDAFLPIQWHVLQLGTEGESTTIKVAPIISFQGCGSHF